MSNPKPNVGFKEVLLWKLIYAIVCCIFSQILFLILFLFIMNLNFFNPLLWIKLTMSMLTSLSTWLLLVPLASIIFAQGIIYSKDYVFETTYRTSRISKYLSVFTLRNLFSLTTHVLISVLTVWLYLTLLGGEYSSMYKTCKENYKCLVEETFFMFLNSIWIGVFYFAKQYLCDEKSITFPVIQQQKFLTIKLTIGGTLKQAVKEAFWPTVYFLILYYFRGLKSKEWFAENMNLLLENESLTLFHVLRNNFIYSWLFSTMFIFSILCMKMYLEIFLTEHWIFPIESEFRNVLTLREALSMNNLPILQHLACFDLYKLSLWDPVRRQQLFTLSQPGGHPHNWNKLLQELLKLTSEYSSELNKATDAILLPTSVNKPIEALKETAGNSSQVEQNPYKEKFLIGSPSKSATLLRNMSLSRCEPANITMITQHDEPNIADKMKSVMKNKLDQTVTIIKKKSGIDYIFGDLPESRMYFLLSKSQPIIWAVQGLSFIATASFTEDSYGVAQKDLPVIITCLIQLKQNIDKLNKVSLVTRKNSHTEIFKTQMKTALRTAVRRSLYNICNTFGEYLPQLRLNKDISLQIQSFTLYKEG